MYSTVNNYKYIYKYNDMSIMFYNTAAVLSLISL